MEDLFQIIFILIFILGSIASSLSKKKKQRQAKNKAQPIPVREPESAASKKKPAKTTSQVLEEILGMKIELPEPQKYEAPRDFSEDSIATKTWDPTKEFEVKTNDGESDYEGKITEKKSEFLEARKKHSAFKKEEKVKVKDFIEVSGIDKLFSKEANLKEYIKVQEILNKPKALRR